jgi:hypothetical protein
MVNPLMNIMVADSENICYEICWWLMVWLWEVLVTDKSKTFKSVKGTNMYSKLNYLYIIADRSHYSSGERAAWLARRAERLAYGWLGWGWWRALPLLLYDNLYTT